NKTRPKMLAANIINVAAHDMNKKKGIIELDGLHYDHKWLPNVTDLPIHNRKYKYPRINKTMESNH
ncbi:6657_t:CDS:1, partial [Dentiscutata heterogama]